MGVALYDLLERRRIRAQHVGRGIIMSRNRTLIRTPDWRLGRASTCDTCDSVVERERNERPKNEWPLQGEVAISVGRNETVARADVHGATATPSMSLRTIHRCRRYMDVAGMYRIRNRNTNKVQGRTRVVRRRDDENGRFVRGGGEFCCFVFLARLITTAHEISTQCRCFYSTSAGFVAALVVSDVRS